MLVCLVYLFTPVVTRARWRRLVNTIAGGGVCVWCREVSGSDEGVYVCRAWNEGGHSDQHATLTVHSAYTLS